MIVEYVRVSTDKQAELGYSIDAQQQNIKRYLRVYELFEEEENINFFIDEGYSGSTLNRPAMQNMLSLIKEK